MAESHSQQQSVSDRFLRGAGSVREDPENRMWAPARWIVQFFQYMIAVIVVAVAEALKAIVSGKKPHSKHHTAHTE